MNDHNKYGQALGRKGASTRRRLMDGAEALLKQGATRKLSASAIAKAAGLASQSFYAYFADVDDLVVALAVEASAHAGEVLQTLDGDWDTVSIAKQMERFVGAFMDYWQRHCEVLGLLTYRADSGEEPFTSIRNNSAAPIVLRIADRLRAVAGEGQVSADDALARSVVLYAGLERLASRARDGRIGPGHLTTPNVLRAEAAILTELLTGPPISEKG